MIIKDLLFKIKEDLKRLPLYPNVNLEQDYKVDYDKYWKKRGRTDAAYLSSWQKQRADIISNMVKSGASVMDVGCGDCALLKYLMDKAHITGIGVDMNSAILASASKLGIEVHEADITKMENLASLPQADYVMGLEILEHMPNPEEFITTMLTKIREGMIFSFPNTGYYLHRLRLLFGSFPLQWILHPGEHVRYWTVRDVKWWVKALGLNLDSLVLYEGVPVLNKMFPSLFSQGIIIKISKKK